MVIVSGPPCSGKTTYVDQHKGQDDIVIDLDKLCVALGSSNSHEHPPAIKSVATAARTSLIDSLLLTRFSGQVWVIETYPVPEAIQRYRSGGAIFRVVDPGQEVCMARAHERANTRETQMAIQAWYDNGPYAGG